MTSTITVSTVGGLPFILAAGLLGTVYYNGMLTHIPAFCSAKWPQIVSKIYGQTSRDMRRLGELFGISINHTLNNIFVKDSVTRSPLYSIYGETIAGVTVVRAFGASSKYLRDMLRCVDTVSFFDTINDIHTYRIWK